MVPHFNSAEEWVEHINYKLPENAFYGNPFYNTYGVDPYTVYDRLFKQTHYYGLSDNELTQLRTYCQYRPLYLNEYYDKISIFLETQGFVKYRNGYSKNDLPLKGAYYRRNNISLFISNLYCPQDFIPNLLDVEIAEFVKNEKTGKVRRVQRKWKSNVPIDDDFGELTAKNFEDVIKEFEIIP